MSKKNIISEEDFLAMSKIISICRRLGGMDSIDFEADITGVINVLLKRIQKYESDQATESKLEKFHMYNKKIDHSNAVVTVLKHALQLLNWLGELPIDDMMTKTQMENEG